MISAELEAVLAELPENPARASLVAAGLGHERVAGQARTWGLLPLLAAFLPADFAAPGPETLAARFRGAQGTRVALTLLAAFEEQGVEALVLKGVGLAARYYPNPWLRPSVDVDLLVRRRDLDAASAIVERLGWKRTTGPGGPLDFGHDRCFVGPQRQKLELHFTPSWHFQARFDVDALFARAGRQAVEGRAVRVLGDGDNLVHQAVHAAGHFFEGVKWLFDLKLQTLGEVAWGEVVLRAREARVASVTGMALRAARQRVRARVPEEVLEVLGPGPVRRALAGVAERIPDEYLRLRSGAMDVLLPDGLSRDWLLRWAAPPLKRAGRLGRRLVPARGGEERR